MKQLSLRLSDKLFKKVKDTAYIKRVTRTDFIRIAIMRELREGDCKCQEKKN